MTDNKKLIEWAEKLRIQSEGDRRDLIQVLEALWKANEKFLNEPRLGDLMESWIRERVDLSHEVKEEVFKTIGVRALR